MSRDIACFLLEEGRRDGYGQDRSIERRKWFWRLLLDRSVRATRLSSLPSRILLILTRHAASFHRTRRTACAQIWSIWYNYTLCACCYQFDFHINNLINRDTVRAIPFLPSGHFYNFLAVLCIRVIMMYEWESGEWIRFLIKFSSTGYFH